jgi:hypothetical protein
MDPAVAQLHVKVSGKFRPKDQSRVFRSHMVPDGSRVSSYKKSCKTQDFGIEQDDHSWFIVRHMASELPAATHLLVQGTQPLISGSG